jgi:3',5'-cyclic-AMP phosphodiesterase
MGFRSACDYRVALIVLVQLGAAAPARGELVIRRLELMTVTDTTAVLTWETNEPANTIVRYGTSSGQLNRTASSGGGFVRYHYCELRGLTPGTKYVYACESGSAKASVGPQSPGHFKTLVRPPGKELFSFATMTDTHVGEQVVARVVVRGKTISEGATWRDASVSHPVLTVGAAVDEINKRGVAFTIIKGDVTHTSTPEEFSEAKRLLERLDKPYYVARGNHDFQRELHIRTFNLPAPWLSFDHDGFHFVIVDTEPFAAQMSDELAEQLKWLADDLDRARQKRTFVFLHRPVPPDVQRQANKYGDALYGMGRRMLSGRFGRRASRLLDRATGRSPSVLPGNAQRLADLLSRHGRVVGVFAGHLHRDYVGTWPERTGNLPYVETASTKEYPCGYAITRVFEGGYMQNYYTPSKPDCLEWSAMTQDVYKNVGYGGKVGKLSDRNFVVRFDRLDLTPKPEAASGQ